MLTRRRVCGLFCSAAVALLFACLACSAAYADVGIVLDESLDTSVARISGSGHSAVYLSRVCPDSPLKLRLCRPGEQGSVISNYTDLGEDQPFEWNVVPLSVYLYGVEDLQDRPLVGSARIKRVLEENYRQRVLSSFCAGAHCASSTKAEWRELVAAGLARSVYVFVLSTTVEQDQALIDKFNALPNRNHFNFLTHNCADFTKDVINSYFPHAARRNFMNDFGMTSPKAIARSLTHYALRHPELHFHVYHFAQVPGTIKRSKEVREGTEQLYHSKKLLLPMALFATHELPAFAASYALTGRFNPQHESEQYPTEEMTALETQIQLAKAAEDEAGTRQLESTLADARARISGTAAEWKNYRAAFDSLVAEAIRQELISNRDELDRFVKRLANNGKPVADAAGALWIEIPGQSVKVGISESNVFAAGSDPQLAYELLLARACRILKSPRHSRENMLEFKKDWAMLQDARKRVFTIANANRPAADHAAALENLP